MCVVGAHVPYHVCGGQMTTLFYSCKSLGLEVSAFTHWDILPTQECVFLNQILKFENPYEKIDLSSVPCGIVTYEVSWDIWKK